MSFKSTVSGHDIDIAMVVVHKMDKQSTQSGHRKINGIVCVQKLYQKCTLNGHEGTKTPRKIFKLVAQFYKNQQFL